jgi:hypothetical protein
VVHALLVSRRARLPLVAGQDGRLHGLKVTSIERACELLA